MTEVTILVEDGSDEVQNKLREKLNEIDVRIENTRGVFSPIKKHFLIREKDKTTEEYLNRSQELGKQKPSGYHG